MKTVIVNGLCWEEEITVDDTLFDDYMTEACTRAVENQKKKNNLKIAAILQVKLKSNRKNNKEYTYNSYKILINAGFHIEAEILRQWSLKEMQVDFRTEPIKSK